MEGSKGGVRLTGERYPRVGGECHFLDEPPFQGHRIVVFKPRQPRQVDALVGVSEL